MTFMEVSAKDGSNIDSLFNELGHQVYDKIKSADAKDDGRISLSKQEHETSSNQSCKC